MKTVLLIITLMAFQIGSWGQTSSNSKNVVNVKNNSEVVASSSSKNGSGPNTSTKGTTSVTEKAFPSKTSPTNMTKEQLAAFKEFNEKNGYTSGPTLVKDGPAYQFFVINPPPVKEASFVYLLGSKKIPGYEIAVCNVKFNANDAQVTQRFSNGRCAPVLQLFVANKKSFVGSILEDEKGNKTTITDATLVEEGNTVRFTVVGKDFSRGFTLETGEILNQNSTTLFLHTDKVGIWKIIKK